MNGSLNKMSSNLDKNTLPISFTQTQDIYFGESQVTEEKINIVIDYSRDEFLSESGIATVKDRYLVGGEHSPQQAFARASCAFASNQDHAQRLYDYASKTWFMFATPVLSNGGTQRGLPISCFLNQTDDSILGLGEHYAENLLLSTSGGGIGTDWSLVRSVGVSTSKGNKTTGVIPFMKTVDSLILSAYQGSTRRGAVALNLRVDHPEIEEFVEIRKPTGDMNRRCLNVHNAVCVTDAFMEAVENGTPWDLIDPHTKEVTKTIDPRELWMKILTTRVATGEPYITFIDTANRALPQFLKDKGLKINTSNLCTEIFLPTSPCRTAVCCLSSVNLECYEEWKDDPLFIEDLMRMLDNVLTVFIEQAPKDMWRAVNSAVTERSVGLGAMGFHLYLQKMGIPFESAMASSRNRVIFKDIHDKALAANLKLGSELGEAMYARGTGRRFSHMMAVAPNASSSIICNSTSPSIEPYAANAFTQKTSSGVFLIKNRAFEDLLRKKYKKTTKEIDNIWSDVIVHDGSVQHLDFLEQIDKDVFKTAREINPMWVIDHAATRQPFIDQGQSVNLYVSPYIDKSELRKIHKEAWKRGLKSLYYLRSSSSGENEKISQTNLSLTTNPNETQECLSCQG